MATLAKDAAVRVVNPGAGQITLRALGDVVLLSELSSSYPLKLLSPRITQPKVALVYALTYGGGLVAGDRVHLCVDVHDSAILVILTQGSTKVFKTKPGQPAAQTRLQTADNFTSQRMSVDIHAGSALFLLPDPVTCFRSARYNQAQTFKVAADASLVLLDWFTSGRKALGEEWVFSRYHSLNEVWIDGKRVARDVMLLEQPTPPPVSSSGLQLPPRSLAGRLAPYSCYATVLLYGPLAESTILYLLDSYAAITVFKHGSRPALIWSASPIHHGQGCVLRVAALETEDVRTWLRTALCRLEGVVGPDVYGKAFH